MITTLVQNYYQRFQTVYPEVPLILGVPQVYDIMYLLTYAMTNASRQGVPTFGRDARYGTNPICFAVPAQEEQPFVLDMATNTAAAGKLELAACLGKAIPLGWALDEKAKATNDPRVAHLWSSSTPTLSARDAVAES